MERVVAYCRVSSREQAKKETIETQVDKIGQYCRMQEWELVKTYRDEAVSGTVQVEDRIFGAQMLRDIVGGSISRVVVYRLDRLGRSPLVIHKALEKLQV